MSGESLYESFVCPTDPNNPFEVANRDYRQLPEYETVDKLIKKETESQIDVFQAPSQVFSDFLKERFGLTLTEFMLMYSKAHFTALGFGEQDGIAVPVGPTTICYFEESHDPAGLAKMLSGHSSCIERAPISGTFLNLHFDQIYKFTLVRAKFDLSAEKDKFYFGYYIEHDHFRFFIRSTVQFDLTVVYQEI